MRRISAITLAALGLAALLAANAGARIVSSRADSCAVSGGGDQFTIDMTIPIGAPRQGGFAIGAPGTTVSDVVISGVSGSETTQRLPPDTSMGQTDQSSLPPGVTSINLETTDNFSGVFRVVPERFPASSSFLAALSCAVPASVLASDVFSPPTSFVWSAAAGSWEASVKVPGPGVLSFHSSESRPLILSNGVVLSRGGVATLTIKPTPAGKAALASRGSITVPLTFVYTPVRGEPASKTITATLRRRP